MMDHYFTNDEHLAHHYETLHFTLMDEKMTFRTDNGVFSKNAVDYGSRVLMETLNDVYEPTEGEKILDVGCGYGAIGLTLAKHWQTMVDMVDVNERALDLARYNARYNEVLNNVHIFTSDGYQQVRDDQYTMIVTNPPIRAGKEVVHRILEEAYDHLANQGTLWVVIQKKQGAPSAKKKMEETFGNATVVNKNKGYYILKSEKK